METAGSAPRWRPEGQLQPDGHAAKPSGRHPQYRSTTGQASRHLLPARTTGPSPGRAPGPGAPAAAAASPRPNGSGTCPDPAAPPSSIRAVQAFGSSASLSAAVTSHLPRSPRRRPRRRTPGRYLTLSSPLPSARGRGLARLRRVRQASPEKASPGVDLLLVQAPHRAGQAGKGSHHSHLTLLVACRSGHALLIAGREEASVCL